MSTFERPKPVGVAVASLSKTFNGKVALNDVSLTIDPGAFVVLLQLQVEDLGAEDGVVGGDILGAVVDDAVGAEGADEFGLGRAAADGDDAAAAQFGELDDDVADAAGGGRDGDGLAVPQLHMDRDLPLAQRAQIERFLTGFARGWGLLPAAGRMIGRHGCNCIEALRCLKMPTPADASG